MVQFGRTDESQLKRDISEEIPKVFRNRYGRDYSKFHWEQLTRFEQDQIINEAGKRANDRRM